MTIRESKADRSEKTFKAAEAIEEEIFASYLEVVKVAFVPERTIGVTTYRNGLSDALKAKLEGIDTRIKTGSLDAAKEAIQEIVLTAWNFVGISRERGENLQGSMKTLLERIEKYNNLLNPPLIDPSAIRLVQDHPDRFIRYIRTFGVGKLPEWDSPKKRHVTGKITRAIPDKKIEANIESILDKLIVNIGYQDPALIDAWAYRIQYAMRKRTAERTIARAKKFAKIIALLMKEIAVAEKKEEVYDGVEYREAQVKIIIALSTTFEKSPDLFMELEPLFTQTTDWEIWEGLLVEDALSGISEAEVPPKRKDEIVQLIENHSTDQRLTKILILTNPALAKSLKGNKVSKLVTEALDNLKSLN